MRPIQVSLRSRALQTALVVTCASSLQFAGCLNNPTRSDLAGEAEKAALRAEHDITQQKLDRAIAQASLETEPHSKPERDQIVLAGGEVADSEADSPILQTGGEETAKAKPSFWSFWKRKPAASAQKESKESADKAAVAKTLEANGAQNVASGKAKLSPSSFLAPKAEKPEISTDTAERWFDKEFVRESVETVKSSSTPVMTQAEKAPADQSSSTANLYRPFPEQPAGESIVKETIKPNPSVPEKHPQEMDFLPAAVSKHPVDTASARQQKLRIQALLSEAHTNCLRGELHAAYRSALLAEKVANEHGIQFKQGEERPQDYAREIASKIWKTSNPSEETYVAATEVAAPIATHVHTPKANQDVKAQKVFAQDSFATWEPLPDTMSQNNASTRNVTDVPVAREFANGRTQFASQSHADKLPEIRPWSASAWTASEPQLRKLSSSQASAPNLSAPTAVATNPSDASSDQSVNTKTDAQPDQGVQFAIAHTTSEDQIPELVDPFTSRNGSFGKSEGSREVASAMLETQRPLLMAPPTPTTDEPLTAQTPKMTWDDLSSDEIKTAAVQKASNADAVFKWRVTWSILGLIGAAVATFIGIKLSRIDLSEYRGYESEQPNQQQADPTPEVPQVRSFEENSQEVSESEEQPLRFKRAA